MASSSIAAMKPPCTLPWGLYHSSRAMYATLTRPGSSRNGLQPSSSAAGGIGVSPREVAQSTSMFVGALAIVIWHLQ
jgi:hypothetical protein